MKRPFKRILYGGDYNPNQWGKEIWKEDMRIFKDARINSATINVFAWAKIQPSENEYNFSELDKVVEMLSEENYDIVFATSTAALPGWMVKKYPEVMYTDYEGRQHRFGQRHNACPNSLVYRKYARIETEWAFSSECAPKCINCAPSSDVRRKKQMRKVSEVIRCVKMRVSAGGYPA